MHILLTGYLFVIVMFAVASGSWLRAALTLFFLAFLPCWLLSWRIRRKQLKRMLK